jgi:hypothetical protein
MLRRRRLARVLDIDVGLYRGALQRDVVATRAPAIIAVWAPYGVVYGLLAIYAIVVFHALFSFSFSG